MAARSAMLWLLGAVCVLGVGVGAWAVGARGATGANQTTVVAQVDGGDHHTCAVTSGGAVECWGFNQDGELGDGTTTNRLSPVGVSGLSSGTSQVSAGYDHACAVTSGGAVKCWGSNFFGQLGDGTTTNRLSPVGVTGLSSGLVQVSAGADASCAVTTGGLVGCWGADNYGQLGDATAPSQHQNCGTSTNIEYCSTTPVAVSKLSGVVQVAAGNVFACALTSAGGVVCWGDETYGELGNGIAQQGAYSTAPVAVQGLQSGVVAIAAGWAHACALTSKGGVECWGDNANGDLGDGTTTLRATPVAVSGLSSGVKQLTAGDYHTCATTSGSGIKCWGLNASGQLGDGSTTSRLTPVGVSGLSSGPKQVAGGGYHSCAVTGAGGVKCWGDNESGELGDGTTTNSSTPVQVQGLMGAWRLTVSVSGSGSVVSSPSGIDCGSGHSACSALFTAGSTVSLSASPASGYSFGGFLGGGCSGGGSTCTVTMSQAQSVTATFTPSPTTTTTTTTTTSTSTPPPTAVLSVPSHVVAGTDIKLDASKSTAGAGSKVVAYDWDMNGDGRIDTTTGTIAQATQAFLPGKHTVKMTVVQADGQRTTVAKTFVVAGTAIQLNNSGSVQHRQQAGPGCHQEMTFGKSVVSAPCIKVQPDGHDFTIGAGTIYINGLALVPQPGQGGFTIDRTPCGQFECVKLHGPKVTFELRNMSNLGNMALGSTNLATNPLQLSRALPTLSKNAQQAVSNGVLSPHCYTCTLARTTQGGPEAHHTGIRFVSFAVGECADKTVPCAKLPGDFPLDGSVNVWFVPSAGRFDIAVDVALNLHPLDFNVTGGVDISVSASTGVQLNSLNFNVADADLSVLKVHDLGFQYVWPDATDYPEEDRDTWDAHGEISLPAVEGIGAEGEVRFRHGSFEYAHVAVNFGAAAPELYPGLTLTEIGLTLGANPFQLGGDFTLEVYEALDGHFSILFRDRSSTEPLSFQVDDSITLSPDLQAALSWLINDGQPLLKGGLVVWGDGSFAGTQQFNIDVGHISSQISGVQLYGGISAFYEKLPERVCVNVLHATRQACFHSDWQFQGQVGARVLGASLSSAHVIANNLWLAACLNPGFGQFKVAFPWLNNPSHHINLNIGPPWDGCRNPQWLTKFAIVPRKGYVKDWLNSHELLDVRRAARRAVTASTSAGRPIYPGKARMRDLQITGKGGLPQFKLIAPDGTSSVTVTSAAYTKLGAVHGSGPLHNVPVLVQGANQVEIQLAPTVSGMYHLVTLPGSVPITQVQLGKAVPAPTVKAQVLRHGCHHHQHHHRCTPAYELRYRIKQFAAGDRVRFVEKANNGQQTLAVAQRASGTIRFTPDAVRDRRRQIEADLVDATGTPVSDTVVARYKAPKQAPGRPHKLKIRRVGTDAVITWRPAPRALRYVVTVIGDGRRLQLDTSQRHRRVIVHQLVGFKSYRVTVRAYSGKSGTLHGKATHGQVRKVKHTFP